MGVAMEATDAASPGNRKLASVSRVAELMCGEEADSASPPASPPVSGQPAASMVDGVTVHLPPRYSLNRRRKLNRDVTAEHETQPQTQPQTQHQTLPQTQPQTLDNNNTKTQTQDRPKTHANSHIPRIDIQINGDSYPHDPASTDNGTHTQDTNCLDDVDAAIVSDSPQQREKDLTIALQWLRQEFQSLRAQDRELARQFISLRSAIRHLQITSTAPLNGTSTHLSRNTSFSSAEDLGGRYTNSSSASDLDGGSGGGGGELAGSRPSKSALRADDYAGGDFRPRTQSLLEPRATASPKLSVRRLGRTISKECF